MMYFYLTFAVLIIGQVYLFVRVEECNAARVLRERNLIESLFKELVETMDDNRLIKDCIKPETDLERSIISDPEFIEGAMWGKPRNGHPEGQVIYHIEEVLSNVGKYATPEDRERLRLIAIIHDTFKHKVDVTKSKSGENHHAMIARRFAEKYITDTEVLDVIELHDEAYNAWSKGDRDGNWPGAERRAALLLGRIRGYFDLYIKFYQCDNETGNKKQDNLDWFKDYCL